MKIKDYSIIETEWIDNWIKTYEDLKYKSALPNGKGQDIFTFETYRHYIYILKEVKKKLQPLIPIIENAFDVGWFEGNTNGDIRNPKSFKQEYINNTIIE